MEDVVEIVNKIQAEISGISVEEYHKIHNNALSSLDRIEETAKKIEINSIKEG